MKELIGNFLSAFLSGTSIFLIIDCYHTLDKQEDARKGLHNKKSQKKFRASQVLKSVMEYSRTDKNMGDCKQIALCFVIGLAVFALAYCFPFCVNTVSLIIGSISILLTVKVSRKNNRIAKEIDAGPRKNH